MVRLTALSDEIFFYSKWSGVIDKLNFEMTPLLSGVRFALQCLSDTPEKTKGVSFINKKWWPFFIPGKISSGTRKQKFNFRLSPYDTDERIYMNWRGLLLQGGTKFDNVANPSCEWIRPPPENPKITYLHLQEKLHFNYNVDIWIYNYNHVKQHNILCCFNLKVNLLKVNL